LLAGERRSYVMTGAPSSARDESRADGRRCARRKENGGFARRGPIARRHDLGRQRDGRRRSGRSPTVSTRICSSAADPLAVPSTGNRSRAHRRQPFRTSRMLTSRRRPPRFAGGIIGSISVHSARSDRADNVDHDDRRRPLSWAAPDRDPALRRRAIRSRRAARASAGLGLPAVPVQAASPPKGPACGANGTGNRHFVVPRLGRSLAWAWYHQGSVRAR
jgi:hypothetical protein